MKDKFYFSHDYEASNDPKVMAMVSEYGAAGYGLFWRIIEMLHADENHRLPLKPYIFLAIAKQMMTDAKQIESFVGDCCTLFELFVTDGQYFWSDRVLRNIEKRDEIREKRREAGQRGANAKQMLANAKQTEANAQQNLAKERKVKESKVNTTTGQPGPVDPEPSQSTDEKFIPPTKEQIEQVFVEKIGFTPITLHKEFAVAFLKYYSASRWHDKAGARVVDWILQIESWIYNENWSKRIESARPKPPQAKIHIKKPYNAAA